MSKKIFIMFICVIIFVGCSSMKNLGIKQNGDIADLEKYHLTISELSTEDGKIEIKAGPLNDLGDVYDGVVLIYNNNVKQYDWENVVNPTYYPIIYYEDVNNDNVKEIIINTTLAYGTGVNLNKLHILNSKNLNEYKIENIHDYIKQNVKVTINDILTVKINGDIQQINVENFSNDTMLFEEAVFSNIIEYKIKDNKINALVPVQISATEFLGSLIFEFDFIDNSFIISNAYYELTQSDEEYEARRKTAYNNIDITENLQSLLNPDYSEEMIEYIKKLYNDKGTLLYQEFTFKPNKIIDLDFSFDLERKTEIDNYTIQMKLPEIWESNIDYGNYHLYYEDSNAFSGNDYLFEISDKFDFKVENLYFLNNGINRFRNMHYFTGANSSGMNYIVLFDNSYPYTGVIVYIQLNNSLITTFTLSIPFYELDLIQEILDSINLTIS